MTPDVSPQFLCIGHLCHDRLAERFVLGGTAAYVSLLVRQLGYSTAILTSLGPDFAFHSLFEEQGIPLSAKPAAHTTVFENIYHEGQRTQYLHARAADLQPADAPLAWQDAGIVLFCPIADEIDAGLFQVFPKALKGATIQGWLRQWDAQGRVRPKAMDWGQLAGLDVVILSDADIAGLDGALEALRAQVPLLVLTQSAAGATVFQGATARHFPAYPVQELDATGAGDVFAAAFMLRFAETAEIDQAAGFAHCAASLVVEGIGVDKLHGLELIEQRFRMYPAGLPKN
ncbi:MAG: hypothetical protein IT260_10095 [Saprospiraceae bacterium]|nr:hypothetical protein [Saprospiraceae bacterium]